MSQRKAPEPEELPSPEQLASELAAMMRTGVTVKATRQAQGLCSLALTGAKSASDALDDRAVAATNLVREACARVDDLQSGNTAVLLGIAPGFRGVPPKVRRQHVADDLHISTDHLRKDRERSMFEVVADEIYAMDSAYRLRHHHRAVRRDETTLQIDWVAQHRSYGRIWTPAVAMRADLMVLLEWLGEQHSQRVASGQPVPSPCTELSPPTLFGVAIPPDEWIHFEDRAAQLTWRLAQHSQAVVKFVEDEGGLWIFGDPEAEVIAADALYRLDAFLPFGDRNKSWMRSMLRRAEGGELDSFMTLLEQESLWPRMFERWLTWAAEAVVAGEVPDDLDARTANFASPREGERSAILTPVVVDQPTTDCGNWLAASDLLLQLVEDDWVEVVDFYRSTDRSAAEH